MRRHVLALSLVLALLAPAAAHAQTGANPFAPQTETSGPVADADRSDDGGLSGGVQTLIIVSGVALVLGIGFFIARDARSVAGEERSRVPDGPRGGPRTGSDPALDGAGGTAVRSQRAKARARKRQKVARASRKRNR